MRSMLAAVLLDHARRHGVDARGIADGFQLPEEHHRLSAWSQDAPALPVSTVIELADAVASALDDPELGLSMVRELERGSYGVQEFAFRNAPTLGEAGKRLVRYQHLTNDTVRYTTGIDSTSAWLRFETPGYADGLGPHLDPFLLMSALSFARGLGGEDVDPTFAHLTTRTLPYPTERLAEALGCSALTLGASTSGLSFARGLWDRPVIGADPALLPVLDAYAEKLAPPQTESSWTAKVQAHLRRHLSGGAPSLEACASFCGLSARTLQRRLQDDCGKTYRQLVDDFRRDEAQRLLSDTELSLDEVSFLLGFSERRALSRAFIRWVGVTPQRYRARISRST